MCRHTILAAELTADDRVVDASGLGTAAAAAAAAWVRRGALTIVLPHAQHAAAASVLAGHPDSDRIDLAVGELETLPITHGAADVAWAIDAIGRWRDPTQCVAALRRVLRPGGRLILTTPVASCGLPGGEKEDPSALQALLTQGGFRGVQVRRYQDGERRILVFMARRPWS